MTINELKAAVAKRLRIEPTISMRDMVKTVELVSGQRKSIRQNGYDYLCAWLGVKREYGPAKWIPPFKPLASQAHPRLADIDAAQPPMMTPNCVGDAWTQRL